MKKMRYVIFLCIIISMLSGCGNKKSAAFNGSRTGDDDHFDISFTILNTTCSHDLEMKQGEKLLVHVEKEAGEIKILIQEGEESPIYEGNGNVAKDFSVGIPKDGTYTVSVNGKEAKGHVTFTRIDEFKIKRDIKYINDHIGDWGNGSVRTG